MKPTVYIETSVSSGDMLAELRAWRDEFARSYGYDLHAMTGALCALDSTDERKVIYGKPRPPAALKSPIQMLQQSGEK